MSDFIVYWHWWVLAVALLIAEMFSPAAIFMWIAFAAAVVGVVDWLFPALTLTQLTWLFAILSVLFLVAGKLWFKKKPIETDHPALNRRGEALVGQVVTVEQAISGGKGRVRVGDTTWKAAGPDSQKGIKVRVNGIESGVLQVERVE